MLESASASIWGFLLVRNSAPDDPAQDAQNQRDGRALHRTDVDVLETHRFVDRQDLQQKFLRYVALYNHQLPQCALKSKTSNQATKDRHHSHPFFTQRPLLVGDAATIDPARFIHETA